MSSPIAAKDKEQKLLIEMRNHKVVKSNNLIQKSHFQLTLQEQKIILYLISKIKPNDNNFDFIDQDFIIVEFCKICGIDHDNGKNYKNLKNTIKTLANKSAWISKDADTDTLIRWINKATISKKSGTIKIRLDEELKPYLLLLKEQFTQYELLYILAMQSQYSIRLYELLKSYEYQKRKTFKIDELKRLLSAENYDRFVDFKRYVLIISMREINELSDLNVTYELTKTGRKFTDINFFINIKDDLDDRLKTWANIDKIISPGQISLYERMNEKSCLPEPDSAAGEHPTQKEEPNSNKKMVFRLSKHDQAYQR